MTLIQAANFIKEQFDIISLKLRYAPGEKFFQTKSARIPINLDAPVIELSHFRACRVLGNRWG